MRSPIAPPVIPASPHPALTASLRTLPGFSRHGNSILSESMRDEGLSSEPSLSVIDQLIYSLSEGLDSILYMAASSSCILMSSSEPRAKPLFLKYSFSSIEKSPSGEGCIGSVPSFAPRMTAARTGLGRVLIIVPTDSPSAAGGITPTSTLVRPATYISVNSFRSNSASPMISVIWSSSDSALS